MAKYIDTRDVHYRIAGRNVSEATVVCVQDFDYYDYTFLNEELFLREGEAEIWLTVYKIQMRASGLSHDQEIAALLEATRYLMGRIEELEA